MIKIIKIALLVLVVLVVAVLGFAATKPDTLRVERSTSINAPAGRIFPLISDFHQWSSWSPYEKRDPAMQRTFSGAPSGKGAIYEWNGNSDVGSGRMEIVDAPAPSKVVIKLDFITPFEGHNMAEFVLTPAGNATNVTWSMQGPNQFIGKVMSVFIDMDDMIGTDFAAGLANLKTISEK
jgi:uncharacterized protein YndB with AHSA1/START domain